MTTGKELKDEFKYVKKLIEILKKNKVKDYKDSRVQILFEGQTPNVSRPANGALIINKDGYDNQLL